MDYIPSSYVQHEQGHALLKKETLMCFFLPGLESIQSVQKERLWGNKVNAGTLLLFRAGQEEYCCVPESTRDARNEIKYITICATPAPASIAINHANAPPERRHGARLISKLWEEKKKKKTKKTIRFNFRKAIHTHAD